MTDPSNPNLRPGKGCHLDLTQETLEFINEAVTDLWNAAGVGTKEEPEFPSLDELIDSDNGIQYLKDVPYSATHWKKSKDNFGTKLYKALDWNDGEIRVTVVLNARGELKLDIRFWYDPESASPNWQK
jgi:hypothetical protein